MEYGQTPSEEQDDIIDLLDIVEPQAAGGGAGAGRNEEAPLSVPGDDVLDLNAAPEEFPAETENSGMSSAGISEDAPDLNAAMADAPAGAEECTMAPAASPDAAGNSGSSLPADVIVHDDAEISCSAAAAAEGKRALEAASDDVRSFANEGDGSAAASESVSERTGLEDAPASMGPGVAARLDVLDAEIKELSSRMDDLDRQIAAVGSLFLNDASVRLNIEEMVSRMLDARLPEPSEDDGGTQPGPSSADFASLRDELLGMKECLAGISGQVERTAAGAAARVIREEISALSRPGS